jgi:thiamine biosynthesis lipoprotein
MKETRVSMGMPVTVHVVDGDAAVLEKIFSYFAAVDERFSTYKESSEISKINRGEIFAGEYSDEMQEVFTLSEITRKETEGYFDIRTPAGTLDPSGLVKGWAISNAAKLLQSSGFENFWVEAGGDIQVSGVNDGGTLWRIGIRNPFDRSQIVKVVTLSNAGIATSGAYIRGRHIYNPHTKTDAPQEVESLTVIAGDVYDADRFATAAYAMGEKGVGFIEKIPGIEAYSIDPRGIATMTSGFSAFTDTTRI